MCEQFLRVRPIWQDLPDLVELGVSVCYRGWTAESTVYDAPLWLLQCGESLLQWVNAPNRALSIEAGADVGFGWMLLRFYAVDLAMHVACSVDLATVCPLGPPFAQRWRVAIEMATELGLVERFARECIALGRSLEGEARLIGLPISPPRFGTPNLNSALKKTAVDSQQWIYRIVPIPKVTHRFRRMEMEAPATPASRFHASGLAPKR
jgi:hypothetical protein